MATPEGFSGVCVRGTPARVLMEHSKSAQMLIVGSRGHGGFAGMLLGSVSSACAEHAGCPVLVVHGERDSARVPVSVTASHEDGDDPVRNS
ncbi:universal stress protein [Arthrobacter alpinus]|nr:universal stress protein [Arthrobacter alpinus]